MAQQLAKFKYNKIIKTKKRWTRMYGCKKCNTITSVLILLAGIGFLLADLNVGGWKFFGLNWWSVIFVIMGLTCLAMGSCKDCQAAMKGK